MVVGVITRESIHKVGLPRIILCILAKCILQCAVYPYALLPSENILEGCVEGGVG